MSSRFASRAEAALAQPVPWPTLEIGGSENQTEESPELIDAQDRLGEALREAERLQARVRELELQVQSTAKENYARGFDSGRTDGYQAAADEQRVMLERMAESIAEMVGFRDKLRREAEADLIRLATTIARRILKKHVQVDPGVLDAVVSSALDKLGSTEVLKVLVHPRQAEAVRARLAVLGLAAPVEGAPSLPEGALRIETGRGELDASLDLQQQEMENAIAARVGR